MKGRLQINDRVRSLNGAKGVVVEVYGHFCTVRWKRRFTNAKASISLCSSTRHNSVLKLDRSGKA